MTSMIFKHRNHICRALRNLTLDVKATPGQAALSPGINSILRGVAIAFALSGPLTRTTQSAFLSTSPSRQPQLPQVWEQRRWAGAATQPLPPEEEVTLTENAIERLSELISGREDQCLRLTVEAGGCSGFSYKFDLDSSINPGDKIFEAGGVKLIADSMSYEFVKGSKIDYSQELIKSSFEVVDNPNADKGCGCGTSFSPK